MSKKQILIPVDFSSVSECCISHAHHIAEQTGAALHVMHLVDEASEIEKGQQEMAAFLEKTDAANPSQVEYTTEVRVGKILTDIGAAAEAMEAMLVVIGTHGLQGLEYIVGTHAIRIVGTANVPFVIVQEKPIGADGYEHIIVPIELESESKQKLELVAQMGKAFDSTVHLLIPHESDEFLFNALKRNLTYAEGFFEQKGIKHTATVARQGSGDLEEATNELAKEKGADLIAIMNWRESRLLGIFGTDDTQDFILNKEQIPVLIMNPKVISNFELFQTTS